MTYPNIDDQYYYIMMNYHQTQAADKTIVRRLSSRPIAIKHPNDGFSASSVDSDEVNTELRCNAATWRLFQRIAVHRSNQTFTYDNSSSADGSSTQSGACASTQASDRLFEGEVFELDL